MQLIADKGIQGLTIKNISIAIGISEPAIYRHFDNKTDILLGIISTIKNSTEIEHSDSMTETQTAFDIIRSVFTARAKQFSENPSLAAVIFSEVLFDSNSQLSSEIKTIMDKSQKRFVNIIKTGQREGEIIDHIDAEQLALMIMGAFRLLVNKWRMSKNSFNLEVQTEKLFKALEKLI